MGELLRNRGFVCWRPDRTAVRRHNPDRRYAGCTRSGASRRCVSTPTIVHFEAVPLLSAIVNAPWQGIVSAAVVLGLLGLAGIVYEVIVVRRMRTQTLYTPQFEDWLFHVLLPCAAYATVAASAYAALHRAHGAMFVLGAAVLLLLFIGIYNAWDAVTYHAFCEQTCSAKR